MMVVVVVHGRSWCWRAEILDRRRWVVTVVEVVEDRVLDRGGRLRGGIGSESSEARQVHAELAGDRAVEAGFWGSWDYGRSSSHARLTRSSMLVSGERKKKGH